jgi:hypothetical protein
MVEVVVEVTVVVVVLEAVTTTTISLHPSTGFFGVPKVSIGAVVEPAT